MKILTIVGARPQFIKAALVSDKLQDYRNIQEKILHTGQHYDANMSEIFFKELKVPRPYHNLCVGSGSHAKQTAAMMLGIEKQCLKEKPDVVMVYGDTNSTLAAALTAAKLHIPVAHVEAGVRSYNPNMPEEINRILTDKISRWLFAPSVQAETNLVEEGIENYSDARIYFSGDVMFDLLLKYQHKIRIPKYQNYFLLTLHRQESTDNPDLFFKVIHAFRESGQSIVWPVHPRVRKLLKKIAVPKNMILIDPVGYVEMLSLIQSSTAVFTDSGGLQKEVCILNKPCFTLRSETEWTETVETGWNELLKFDPYQVQAVFKKARWNRCGIQPFGPTEYYGDGNAAEKIAKRLSMSA